MSILKEGFGCSDEDLFEKCEFDMLTRRALGLVMLDDVTPAIETYYLLRRRICNYHAQTGIDLLKKCFDQVTGEQTKEFKVSGKSVRMDSKLIGSNIAATSRYELIHSTLIVFLKSISLENLPSDLLTKSKEYLDEDAGKTAYRSDKDTINNRLLTIGKDIYAILKVAHAGEGKRALLQRVFDDQYIVVDEVVELRNGKDVSANSLQSPYDEDASFRNKNDHKTQGYVTNITETIEENKPAIITSVQTETATHGDCSFLQDAITNTERVTGEHVEVSDNVKANSMRLFDQI